MLKFTQAWFIISPRHFGGLKKKGGHCQENTIVFFKKDNFNVSFKTITLFFFFRFSLQPPPPPGFLWESNTQLLINFPNDVRDVVAVK